MGVYIRPSRFLKLRISKRGVRPGGGGGDGISTGAGPVTYYRPLRRRRGRR